MDETLNPADGRRYSSKSQYERAVKAAGAEIVGNDSGYWNKAKEPKRYQPKGVKESIKKAWDQLGY